MSEVFEKVIAELNLDRSDWQLVKFGDVAIQQKKSVDRENTELTRYVKGEHMHSEDIHLREWGELTDEYLGPAFIRKFEKGDILYGSRRTYLRKVVIAPFEGITSNTTFVIKANEEKIDKRLLPFIMLSEGFSQHSIKNSKGSVNPYVNWKDLSGYEFLLPPKRSQVELINLLNSLDSYKEAFFNLSLKLERTRNSQIKHLREGYGNFVKLKIKDLMTFIYGSALKESERIVGDFPVISSAGIQGTHNENLCKGPGIIVGRKGNVGAVTYTEENFWAIDTAYYIEINKKYSNYPVKFFSYLLESENLKKYSIATAVPGLNRDDAHLTKVNLPSLSDALNYVSSMEDLENAIKNQEVQKGDIHKLTKTIINRIF